ncbi:MAG TPA: NAD(P)-dependent oxidoreductase [Anaerolineaceae bacterium]
MMNILITGGTGAVGKAVVERLAAKGFTVKVIGRSSDVDIPGAQYTPCDITDYPNLRAAVRGIDAVIHLAAVPNPSAVSSEQVFLANAQGTFNVYKACEEEGIQRVVQASSINALGVFYGKKPAPIHYLPVDEEHPCLSSDVYSFSKHVIEDIGDYYWRRSGISGVALRLPWVAPQTYRPRHSERQKPVQALVERLLALSADERTHWFHEAWTRYNELRAQGMQEDRQVYMSLKERHPEWFGEALSAMSNRVNFWTMLDERDSAQAIEKSLTASYEGSHVLFVNDDKNWTGVPSQTLAELFYPDVTQFKKPLTGLDTFVSIEKARQLIGFEVEYSFGEPIL